MPYSAGLAAGVPGKAGYLDADSGQDRHTQRYLLIFKSVGGCLTCFMAKKWCLYAAKQGLGKPRQLCRGLPR